MHKFLISFPAPCTLGLMAQSCNPSPWEVVAGDQKFEVILGYKVSSKQTRDLWDPFQKEGKRRGRRRGRKKGGREKEELETRYTWDFPNGFPLLAPLPALSQMTVTKGCLLFLGRGGVHIILCSKYPRHACPELCTLSLCLGVCWVCQDVSKETGS